MTSDMWSRVSTSQGFNGNVVYSYYTENIEKSKNRNVVPFEIFNIAFPQFLSFGNTEQVVSPVSFNKSEKPVFYSSGSIFERVKDYFNKKFGK